MTTHALLDFAPTRDTFRQDVLQGLAARPRTLPSKYFYDAEGSRLFGQICRLPEYYLTRTEVALLEACVAEMARVIGPDCVVVEYGGVSERKTRILLNHLATPRAYVPVDISRSHLVRSVAALRTHYPNLEVLPVCADFARPLSLPDLGGRRTVVFFPGSTIGNFAPRAARALLRQTATLVGSGGGLLLGTDLKKDRGLLEAAYNDAAGVTAAFNKNLLQRINRELGGTFDPASFAHRAVYDAQLGRVEMYLISRRRQRVRIADRVIDFDEGTAILTEWSYKYDAHDIARLGEAGGYAVTTTWMDTRRLFSLQMMTC